MSSDRYVVAGLAHVRSSWFVEVSRWATVGSLPIEFVKCLSAEELRSRVAGGRPFSAALLDGGLPAVDRDLLARLDAAGVTAIVVNDGTSAVDWRSLGAAAVLTTPLDRAGLLDALAAHSRPVSPVARTLSAPAADPGASTWRGPLVAVTGRPGSGVSTIAAASAQALADDPRFAGEVVLADLALRASQSVLHDARDVVPGIQELVEAHRSGWPSTDHVAELTFAVPARGYRLLLGLRRHRDWVTLRPESFATALDGLRSAARAVVADVDRDLEGEAETGSFDIEDRNLMARRAIDLAALVIVVAPPTGTGIAGLVAHLADLRATGLGGSRTLVVVNRAPRRPRARAELTRALAELTATPDGETAYIGPVYLPERRGIDEIHRDVARFPSSITGPLVNAVGTLLDTLMPRDRSDGGDLVPTPVAPGSVGSFTDDEPLS